MLTKIIRLGYLQNLTDASIPKTLKSVDALLFPTLLTAIQVMIPSSDLTAEENDRNPSLIVTLSSCAIRSPLLSYLPTTTP